MLTWSLEFASPVLACGVDAERIERFEKFSNENRPWAAIFSDEEIDHHLSLAHPARGFCAAFCCKEAFFKAVEKSIDFRECALFYDASSPEQTLRLSEGLLRRFEISEALVQLRAPHLDELSASVYLLEDRAFGKESPPPSAPTQPESAIRARSYLKDLSIPIIDEMRGALEARALTGEEREELADRKSRTLAGFLAAKGALITLARSSLGMGDKLREVDFSLTHAENGAPRIVSVPEGFPRERVFISITHTHKRAYGLAVYQAPGL